jgi:hypothetical protein
MNRHKFNSNCVLKEGLLACKNFDFLKTHKSGSTLDANYYTSIAVGHNRFSVIEELSSHAFCKIAALVSPRRWYPELPDLSDNPLLSFTYHNHWVTSITYFKISRPVIPSRSETFSAVLSPEQRNFWQTTDETLKVFTQLFLISSSWVTKCFSMEDDIKIEICTYAPTLDAQIYGLFSFKKKTAKLFSCCQQSWDTDSLISCHSRHKAAVSNALWSR